LTCRRFRNLARALIFRSVSLICSDESDLSSARLDFYSSDGIAPFVRKVHISGNIIVELENATLIAKIFDALPRFINIRSLFCFNVEFTQFALHQVSTLSFLERIVAMSCSAPPKTDLLPMLRPRVFTCDDRSNLHHWLALLDPDHLQALHVPLIGDLCPFFFANDNPALFPFPSLRAVRLDVDLEALSVLPMLLSKTPTLRSLKISVSYFDLAQHTPFVEGLVPPTTCPVPDLEEYRGPHKLLPIILGRAMGSSSTHLRRLFLNSIDAAERLDAFMNSLKSCHTLQLRALTHLHISLPHSMDLKSLALLRDMFPVLQEFYLHASEKYLSSGLSCEFSKISCPSDATLPPSFCIAFPQNVDLTELYTFLWPSTLVSLSIQWTSNQDAAAVPDLVEAKVNLLLRLPFLRRLWLYDSSKQALLWSRTAPRNEERCTLHQGE
jgi:hypothetical protein